ncbi:MAG: GNAT family N-acetyltransferase [DPANN group archaeon]|nr:GNAT family N-acetyltransferase [DPANN group archaeon]
MYFEKHLFDTPFQGSVIIEELAIRSEYQGQGFGTLLIEHLINYCVNEKYQ